MSRARREPLQQRELKERKKSGQPSGYGIIGHDFRREQHAGDNDIRRAQLISE